MKKRAILKSSLLIIGMAGVFISAYFLMRAFGLDDVERLKQTMGPWVWVAIAALQAFQVVLLPVSNQIITIPASLALKDDLLGVFLASWAGIEAGTLILYAIGRYGGKKAIAWILSDRDEAERVSGFLKKGRWVYPIGMVIGVIPDDILTTLAGVGRYDFWYVLGVSLATRGICTACSVWGFGFLTRYWWGWLTLMIGVVALVVATIGIMSTAFRKEPRMDHYK